MSIVERSAVPDGRLVIRALAAPAAAAAVAYGVVSARVVLGSLVAVAVAVLGFEELRTERASRAVGGVGVAVGVGLALAGGTVLAAVQGLAVVVAGAVLIRS